MFQRSVELWKGEGDDNKKSRYVTENICNKSAKGCKRAKNTRTVKMLAELLLYAVAIKLGLDK